MFTFIRWLLPNLKLHTWPTSVACFLFPLNMVTVWCSSFLYFPSPFTGHTEVHAQHYLKSWITSAIQAESFLLPRLQVTNLSQVTKSRKKIRFSIWTLSSSPALPLLVKEPLACHFTPRSHSFVDYKTERTASKFVAWESAGGRCSVNCQGLSKSGPRSISHRARRRWTGLPASHFVPLTIFHVSCL